MKFDYHGKLVATPEDYTIERNTVHVNTIGPLVVFRILTDDGQLFAAAIDKHASVTQQKATAMLVKHKAETAALALSNGSFIEVAA